MDKKIMFNIHIHVYPYVQYVEVHVNVHALTLHVPSSVSGNISLCILCLL